MNSPRTRLYRDKQEGKLMGVCAGLADYAGVDPIWTRLGFLALFAGIVVLMASLEFGAGPEIVTWPMLLAGLGIGALPCTVGDTDHDLLRCSDAIEEARASSWIVTRTFSLPCCGRRRGVPGRSVACSGVDMGEAGVRRHPPGTAVPGGARRDGAGGRR